MRKLTKTFVSKERFRKQVIFRVLILFVGITVFQHLPSPTQASLIDDLPGIYFSPPDVGSPPTVLVLYPTDGEIVNGILALQWTAQDVENGTNLAIYVYLNNEYNDTCSAFSNIPYENSGEVSWDTTRYPDGEYTLLLEALDGDGNVGLDTCTVEIKNSAEWLINNEPMKPNQPFGTIYNRMGHEYSYTTSTVDPDGDLLYYQWDWGDGDISGWLGPYHCGIICEEHHTWTTVGSYNIVVKAKDFYGTESTWSDPLSITIPSSYKPIYMFLDLFFQQFPYALPFLQKLLGF